MTQQKKKPSMSASDQKGAPEKESVLVNWLIVLAGLVVIGLAGAWFTGQL